MASGDPVGQWAALARKAGARYNIPPSVLLGLIRVESGGREGRTSSAHAGGLTQFIPSTAREYGVDVRPGHAESQIMGAAKYLRALGFSQHPQRALNAYNGAQVVGGRANPYAANVLSAARSYGSVGGGSGGSGGGSSVVSVPAGGAPSAGPDLGSNDVSGAITALLSGARPAAPPVSGPAAPAYAARAALPRGFAPPSSGGPSVAQGPDVSALLDAVRTQGGGLPVSGGSDAGGGVYTGSGGASVRGGSGRMPTAVAGKVIGTPYQGTHTLGNWQSDNADDVAVPKGTPMVAVQDSTVVKVRHHPQDGGRFAGDQITLRGANGNEYFYAHGVASVKPGQRVRKGDSLGVTGSANGVEHLHFAQRRGNPGMHTRR